METLAQIYPRWGVTGPDVGHADKGGTHSYIQEYEHLLAPYRVRQESVTMMEIGLALGFSLSMWREYMPKATLVGVDKAIVFERGPHTKTGTILVEADATKPELLERLGSLTFDVVIDDASHMTDDQCATFKLLKPRMNPRGIYIIEDILALESERKRYGSLHGNFQVIDNRQVKGRFDDILLVYRF
jgi:hypothetical protein